RAYISWMLNFSLSSISRLSWPWSLSQTAASFTSAFAIAFRSNRAHSSRFSRAVSNWALAGEGRSTEVSSESRRCGGMLVPMTSDLGPLRQRLAEIGLALQTLRRTVEAFDETLGALETGDSAPPPLCYSGPLRPDGAR